jgi:hypothetical protein
VEARWTLSILVDASHVHVITQLGSAILSLPALERRS